MPTILQFLARPTRALLFVALTSVLAAGCSTMSSTQSGFLSGYGQISVNSEGARGAYRSDVAIDPARARVTEVRWHVKDSVDISAADQAQLTATLRDELAAALKALPPRPDGREIEVRAAITLVKTVSPALNVATTALLFVPLDEGGAAVEIEGVDAQTRKQLAALVVGRHAPLSEFKARFSTLAPAEFALREAAQDFVHLVDQQTLK